MIVYVRFLEESQTRVVQVFAGPQSSEYWDNLAEIEDTDQRYLDFINPPPDYLAISSAKLQAANRLAFDQKTALTSRIGVINDAIEFEEATPEEVAELPERQIQLTTWKRYAVLLGRVNTQPGWYMTADWPPEPAEGMDLTVSVVISDTA